MRTVIAQLPWLLLCVACGATGSQVSGTGRVDFSYELEGQVHQVGELRRRPVMIVLMRTSEVVSQIYMKEVSEVFRKRAGQLRILVLSVEPSEKPFVGPYAEFEKLPFPIGVAEQNVALGGSSLGAISAVPVTYLVDSDGGVVYSAPGVLPAEQVISEIDGLLDI